ncbi:head-tail connector protein [Limosilactobacillus reuteri]|uniref:head-tail connector protein n=1 Tax=Limosilactobacillus reuteri TaxID=1598 RepID=UPI003991568C
MADNSTDEVVSTDEMMTELNLDQTQENNAVISELIKDSAEIIMDSFTSNLSASAKADPIYIRAVKALTTAMYYDRSLSGGFPLGVNIMIDHLKARYDEWPESKNGKE